jgi:hypothetical protein
MLHASAYFRCRFVTFPRSHGRSCITPTVKGRGWFDRLGKARFRMVPADPMRSFDRFSATEIGHAKEIDAPRRPDPRR